MNSESDVTEEATVAGGPLTELAAATRLRPGGTGSEATTRSGGPSAGVVVDTGVAQLVDAWEDTNTPPEDLRDFLPDTDAIRRAALIELIMVDLAYRWIRVHRPKRITDYCLEFPELLAGPIPPELVYEEYRVRRLSGENVSADDYVVEFPEEAERFTWLLEHDPRSSSEAVPSALPDSDELQVGGRLDDFELVAELGHGAFARVFLARQTAMQRWVALKLSRNVGAEPQTLAQLDHPNIVRVYDQRVLEDRRLRALFMEYVPGGTLLDVVRLVRTVPPERRTGRLLLDSIDRELARKGAAAPGESSVRSELAALSWPETVAWIGRRLAEALQYARDRGVLHRDVKPANVLLTAEGIPKLADFNVSSGDTVAVPGSIGAVAGSLAYMSPEQLAVLAGAKSGAADARIDTRSDIYSLGVMMWELLAGERPFPDDETPAAALESRWAGVDGSTAARLPAGCPAALRRVLLTALEPQPERRWSSGRKFARQFALCLDPRARELVDPRPGSRRSAAVRWAVPIVLLATGIPNLIATGYNYYYNRETIIRTLPPDAQQGLEQVHFALAAIAYPLGAALILWWCWLAVTVPRHVQAGGSCDAQMLRRARRATLALGHRAVVVAFVLWVVAGTLYPISLQIAAGAIPVWTYSQLVTSMAVCGAVAVGYPYFFLTYFAVRSLYPVLLSHGEIHSEDGHAIRHLGRLSTRYLAVAASVPLVGVAGLSLAGPNSGGHVEVTVRLLCLGGIVGFIAVYQLFRRIEADLRALRRVVTLGEG